MAEDGLRLLVLLQPPNARIIDSWLLHLYLSPYQRVLCLTSPLTALSPQFEFTQGATFPSSL